MNINKDNKQFRELTCFGNLFRKLCGKQTSNEDTSLFYSFKDNFKLANYYWFKYFKFNNKINSEVEQFIKNFDNNKILGLHFRGTDKNKVNWVEPITIDQFIKIIDYHMTKNIYEKIFISTDDNNFIKVMKEKYDDQYKILYYVFYHQPQSAYG